MFTTPFEKQLERLFIRRGTPLGEPTYWPDLLVSVDIDRVLLLKEKRAELKEYLFLIQQDPDLSAAQRETCVDQLRHLLAYGSSRAALLMVSDQCVLRRRIAQTGNTRLVYDVTLPRHQMYDECSDDALDKIIRAQWGINVTEAAVIEVKEEEWLQRCGVMLDAEGTWISGPKGSTTLPLYRHVMAARKIITDFKNYRDECA